MGRTLAPLIPTAAAIVRAPVGGTSAASGILTTRRIMLAPMCGVFDRSAVHLSPAQPCPE